MPQADDSIDPRIGQVLQDRYRILDVIGEGATGTIYRAERVKLGRLVAVKFLRAGIADDRSFRKRFEREALAMSRLGHPHCVSVLDFGFAGSPYIVMEYVTGATLLDLLDDGPLPVGRALHITRQVLGGLAHAHRQGIVHRDVKPANVMLTEATGTGDHVRILDFGLATLRGSNATHDVSQGTIIVGTPSYMSPEQTLGEKVDARSDLYSVGVVLFQLLTGQKPYDGDDAFATLELHRSAPVPRLADYTDAELPEGLQGVIDRAMAKDVDARFPSAREFAEAIDAAVADDGVPVPMAYQPTAGHSVRVAVPRRPRPMRWWGAAVIVLPAAAMAGALWWYAREPRGDEAASARGAGVAAQPAAPSPVAIVREVDAGAIAAVLDAAPVVDASVTDGMPASLDLPPDELEEPVAAVADTEDEPDEPAIVSDDEPATPPAREVNTVDDAKALIAEGRRDEAIDGLRRLRRKHPKSAYIPYLLGNLYFDRKWWSEGMKQYAAAIDNNRAYRKRATLNQNVIRALGSDRTRSRAVRLFLDDIGRPGLPFLRKAARDDRNPKVRKRAAWLVGKLTKPSKKKRGRR